LQVTQKHRGAFLIFIQKIGKATKPAVIWSNFKLFWSLTPNRVRQLYVKFAFK
jgi:hypothetical protein